MNLNSRDDDPLVQALERLLADVCTPDAVLALEQGGPLSALWQPLLDAGFADALLPEAQGGAALTWQQAGALWFTLGRHACPLPLASTQWARSALMRAGQPVPNGPVVLTVSAVAESSGAWVCSQVPGGMTARAVLTQAQGRWCLLDTAAAKSRQPIGIAGDLHAHLRWSALAGPSWPVAADDPSPLLVGALITAAQMAGGLQRLLAMTVDFCGQRVQFGKPIAQYQAVQHQLAVMAEEAAAARMAVEMACADASPHPLRVAMAKARCGDAVAQAVPIAHALHGAIGVTQAFSLPIFTRALQAWRNDYGSAPYWHDCIGRAAMAATGSAFHFIETQLTPP